LGIVKVIHVVMSIKWSKNILQDENVAKEYIMLPCKS